MRYTTVELPNQRYLPGESNFPPEGNFHSILSSLDSEFNDVEKFQKSETYKYGIDLYNNGFWWETHEVFEKVWLKINRTSQPALLIQSIILLAAIKIKVHQEKFSIIPNIKKGILTKLPHLPNRYMNLDISHLIEQVKDIQNKCDIQVQLLHS